MSTGERELHDMFDAYGVDEANVSIPKFSLAELKKFKVAELRQLAVGFSINPTLRKPELQQALRVHASDYDEDEADTLPVSASAYNTSSMQALSNLSYEQQVRLAELQLQNALLIERERVRLMAEHAELSSKLQADQLKQLHVNKMEELNLQRTNNTNSTQVNNNFRVDIAIRLAPKFDERDIDLFFTNFEKVAACNQLDKINWCAILQPLLIGKAARAFFKLSVSEANDYDVLKLNVLKAYEHVPEFYKNKFRNFKKREFDSYTYFAQNMSLLCERWLTAAKVESDFEKLKELVLLEQFYNSVPNDLKVHLLDKTPDNLIQAARKADEYDVLHKTRGARDKADRRAQIVDAADNADSVINSSNSDALKQSGTSLEATQTRSSVQHSYRPRKGFNRSSGFRSWRGNNVVCGYCKKPGHFTSQCRLGERENQQHVNYVNTNNLVAEIEQTVPKVVEQIGFINTDVHVCDMQNSVDIMTSSKPKVNSLHIPVTFFSSNNEEKFMLYGFKDTGASVTIVREGIIPQQYLQSLHKTVELIVLCGSVQGIPLFRVTVQAESIRKVIDIAVVPAHFHMPDGLDMICGTDLCAVPVSCYPVETRAQRRKTENEKANDGVASIITSNKNDTGQVGELLEGDAATAANALNSDNVIDTTPVVTPAVGESENNLSWLYNDLTDVHVGEISTAKLVELQREDRTLDKLFSRVTNESDSDNDEHVYVNDNGLLMRQWRNRTDYDVIDQIVLPYCLRSEVLKIAHDVPAAGHLGMTKTKNRILRYFYWPNIYKDITKYVRSCDVCQRIISKTNKAPMCKPAIIEQAFSRISIDTVGPIRKKTQQGNSFILTIVDHATHFPEAYAIPDHTAKTVASCMVDYFARYGFPSEILHDLGTEFTSELFQLLAQYFGIKQLKCSVMHPETNSMVERFHGALKKMLKAYVDQHDDEWDKALCYLLFAYREVPVAEYGYSPFEMVYGRYVKGPLSILHDSWWEDPKAKVSQNVVQHMLETRNKIEKALDTVHARKAVSQTKAKEYYDNKNKVKSVTFEPGDLVLVLQNIDGKPLCPKFDGPYKVLRQITPVDYHRKAERLLHVNMLKKYVTRTEFINYCETEVKDAIELHDEAELNDNANYFPTTSELTNKDQSKLLNEKLSHLDVLQQEQFKQMLVQYVCVISDKPGCTDIVEHQIKLRPNAKPVSLRPYRLSPSNTSKLKAEIDSLLNEGFIEPFISEWSSPAIVLPKPDGSIRCIIDFRKANAMFESINFPLSRVDDLIDKVQSAKFLSKFDLSKGFYQVKLSQDSKPYTAFCTPFGLFQWTRTPFGLKTSASLFQSMICKVLKGLEHICGVYIDDIIVFSNSFEEHLHHVSLVLNRLMQHKLTVKLIKCHFACKYVDYLGHTIGQGVMSPLMAKVKALLDMPRPSNKKQLQSVLGSIGYYQRYVPHYSDLVAPLTEMLKGRSKFEWSQQAEQCFVKVKELLASKPILQIADFTKPFYLFVDASSIAVGAVLTQLDVHVADVYKPVCYFSRKLTDCQKRYCVTDREALAIILSFRNFHIYLSGHVVVFSDHEPLHYIHKMAKHNVRLMRWALELAAYNLEVRHIKGIENKMADFLSR